MISEFVEDVVTTSDEKKAPPYMERLQKEHCMLLRLFVLIFLIVHNFNCICVHMSNCICDPNSYLYLFAGALSI